MVTCSGRVHPLAVNDNVHLVEDIQYQVTKIFPEEGTVRLKKINSSDRPFKRSLHQIWLPPPPTCEVSVSVDLPTNNCLCPDPEPPRILPDIADKATQTDSNNSSFQQLEDAYQEIKKQLKHAEARLTYSNEVRTSTARTLHEKEEECDKLANQLKNLNDTHNELMNHSLQQMKKIHGLEDRLRKQQNNPTTTTQSESPNENVLQLLRRLLLTLPTDLDKDYSPDDILYYFICSSPSDNLSTLTNNANLLIKSLHPDRSTIPNDPLVQEARNLPGLIKRIKHAITNPAIRQVYDHCGLPGLHRLLSCKLRCTACIPRRPDGAPARQGGLEYPQLEDLLGSKKM